MVDPGSVVSQAYALSRDTLLVTGPDRKSWLDGLLTCAVATVSGGAAGYGLLLTKQGKIVTDAFLADTGTSLFVGVAPGRGPAVHELLDRYLVMEDAELSEPEQPVAWQLVTKVDGAGDVSTALARGALTLGTLETEVVVKLDAPSGLTNAAELLAAHGLGVFGVDFGERDNPHEASLDRIAVSWTKGCYLGQEVVCMQDMRGRVKRRLVALDGSAKLLAIGDAAAHPDVLAPDGSVAGQVSSVHRTPGGARIFASIVTSALDPPSELTTDGEPLRVAYGSAST